MPFAGRNGDLAYTGQLYIAVWLGRIILNERVTPLHGQPTAIGSSAPYSSFKPVFSTQHRLYESSCRHGFNGMAFVLKHISCKTPGGRLRIADKFMSTPFAVV